MNADGGKQAAPYHNRIAAIDGVDRVNRVNKVNRVNRFNRINKVNRVNRVDGVNQVNAVNRANRVNTVNKVSRVNMVKTHFGDIFYISFKIMYLVGFTSKGQNSGSPVNRVFRWSISRIMTFWAQLWNRSDPFYILAICWGQVKTNFSFDDVVCFY